MCTLHEQHAACVLFSSSGDEFVSNDAMLHVKQVHVSDRNFSVTNTSDNTA